MTTTQAPSLRSAPDRASQRSSDPVASRLAHLVVEVGLFLGAAGLYFGIRGLTEGRPDAAYRNAGRVAALERALSLNHEPLLQQSIVDSSELTRMANWVYIFGHWPVIAVVLSWLLIRHSDVFRRARTAMFASGLTGMVVFATFPVAPPRLAVAELVDTVTEQSHAYRVLQPAAFTNQYAAMPSLHVGWNLVVGLALCAVACHRWQRVVGVALPAAMTAAVLVTANHYILDVLAGGLLAGGAWMLASDRARPLRSRCRRSLDTLGRRLRGDGLPAPGR
jgi:membrane-associated phospholipid phosphatase